VQPDFLIQFEKRVGKEMKRTRLKVRVISWSVTVVDRHLNAVRRVVELVLEVNTAVMAKLSKVEIAVESFEETVSRLETKFHSVDMVVGVYCVHRILI
jgi:hypothetical protein